MMPGWGLGVGPSRWQQLLNVQTEAERKREVTRIVKGLEVAEERQGAALTVFEEAWNLAKVRNTN